MRRVSDFVVNVPTLTTRLLNHFVCVCVCVLCGSDTLKKSSCFLPSSPHYRKGSSVYLLWDHSLASLSQCKHAHIISAYDPSLNRLR